MDYKTYLSNLDAKPIFIKNSMWVHSEKGTKYLTDSPLAELHQKCIEESYKGKSVKLKSMNIDSSETLHKMMIDYLNLRIMLGMGGVLYTESFSKNDHDIVRTAEFHTQVSAIQSAYPNILKCIKADGWQYNTPPSKS